MKTPEQSKSKFTVQRHDARKRGIKFNLTFEEWCGWWNQTGHWYERGVRKGQYVMARFDDTGSYKLNNIKCITCTENHKEARINIKQRPPNYKLLESVLNDLKEIRDIL